MQEALTRGKKLLLEREKLIKIADRSEFDWGVVAEYTADELADDSDDENQLDKAKKAAERKAGKRKRKRVEPGSAKLLKPRFNPGQALPVASPQAGPPPVYQTKRPTSAPSVTRPVGPCFACGEMGHLRSYCPKTAAAESREWYPFDPIATTGVLKGSQIVWAMRAWG